MLPAFKALSTCMHVCIATMHTVNQPWSKFGRANWYNGGGASVSMKN